MVMTSKTMVAMTLALALFIPSLGAGARDILSHEEQIDMLLWEDAKSRERVDSGLAPIRSSADLSMHLASMGQIRSPLGYLSSDAQRRFLGSIRFGQKGISSFDFTALVAELSVSQAYEVLRLFGQQHTIRSIPGLRIETDVDRAIMQLGMRPAFCSVARPIAKSGVMCDDDHWHNMKCGSPGTCRGEVGSICTSNC
jgi:hypothetical protein